MEGKRMPHPATGDVLSVVTNDGSVPVLPAKVVLEQKGSTTEVVPLPGGRKAHVEERVYSLSPALAVTEATDPTPIL